MISNADGGFGLRVLLVDDHADLRRSVRALLQGEGMLIVAEATEGLAALDAARLTKPDVVVTDVRMPGMDGLEVTRRLRAIHPGLPVVVYTGDESQTVRTLAQTVGACALVLKGGDPGIRIMRCRGSARSWWRTTGLQTPARCSISGAGPATTSRGSPGGSMWSGWMCSRA